MIKVEQVGTFSEDILHAVNWLLPQLTENSQQLKSDQLAVIIKSESTTIFIAKENENIVGCLTLIMVQIPSGIRAIIEDVIVDERARGKGIGRFLTEAAILYAKEHGAKNINLTSSPKREAANILYQKMGFIKRETNVYRMIL